MSNWQERKKDWGPSSDSPGWHP